MNKKQCAPSATNCARCDKVSACFPNTSVPKKVNTGRPLRLTKIKCLHCGHIYNWNDFECIECGSKYITLARKQPKKSKPADSLGGKDNA